ncbi:MAG: hypothetical protein HY328_04450 [Chloroflexi bacterium]|nr:hypothetical protein [Chloroflexota bacterium]
MTALTIPVTKSVRLSSDESEMLAQISQTEGVSESAVLRRLVREGLNGYRLEQAVHSYQRGESDMQAAARYAGVSVYHLMVELEKRDIAPPATTEKFVDGLKTLVETFGGSQALRETIAEYEADLTTTQPDSK